MKFIIASVVILSGYFFNPVFFEKKPGNEVPELNQKIIEFVKESMNKKVGRGECWDLAAQALDKYNASWDHRYKYGKQIDPVKDIVFPGDIIQFENVVLKYKKGNRIAQETMDHHTAIVYEVKESGVFVIAHQNTHFSGKKVGTSELDLTTVVKGKIRFYRPVS